MAKVDLVTETGTTRRHLLIAGTGRAGTSFLVRYLTDMGLDTHISRHGDAQWYEDVNAGFEGPPFPAVPEKAPYVVKSAWLFEFIDTVIADKTVQIDAVIIPMRNLFEAATSRVLAQRQAMHRDAPWMASLEESWETWGSVPGGILFSLHPIDQARILAVGFYELVEKLIRANIPIVFLEFPRLAEDWEYLFKMLRHHLPEDVTEERAREVHQHISDVSKIRVSAELASTHGADYEKIDLISMRRELQRLRKVLSDSQARDGELSTKLINSDAEIRKLRAELTRRDDDVAKLHAELIEIRSKSSWKSAWPLRIVARAFRR